MNDVITFPINLEASATYPAGITIGTGPHPARADRSEMLAVISGSLALLGPCTERSGAAYRKGLVERMREILARERGTSR